MRASSVMGCAFLASSLISQIAGCAASRPVSGTESSRTAAVQGKNGIEAPSQTHEPSSGANAEPCAMGWMQIAGGVCVRFSKLEQGDDPRGKLIAMDLLSRTGYVHLNLRISVFRGAQKWCAFPGVLSLYQIEPNHQYAFRVPCSMSGAPVDSGEPRLAAEVDEAIEMPRPH
jgi:hypothetical protein